MSERAVRRGQPAVFEGEPYRAIRNLGIWGFWKVDRESLGQDGGIPYPARCKRLDYEGELAIVIGKEGKGNHLIGACEQRRQHLEAERLRGLEVDHQIELDRGLHGKLARLRALEDAISIARNRPMIIDHFISVGQQAAEFAMAFHGRNGKHARNESRRV